MLSKRLNSLQVNRCPSLQKELMRYLSWGWQATFRGESLTPLNLWPLTTGPLLASSLGKVSVQILSPSAQKPPGPRGPIEPPHTDWSCSSERNPRGETLSPQVGYLQQEGKAGASSGVHGH